MTVSVIIPCYNQTQYLPLAIESVLQQTFSELEAIIIDDGSTEDVPAVVARFEDTRLRFIRQDNQGLSAARNTGIRAARGRYLAFLDADDEWYPQFLIRCVNLLETDTTLAGVYSGTRFIDARGNLLPGRLDDTPSRADFSSRIWERSIFPPCAVVVRTHIVRAVGLFDTSLTSVEDWDLFIRISQEHDLIGTPDTLARYRVYPGTMSTNAARMHRNRLAVLSKHFGPPSGDPVGWSAPKRRAYGFAFRTAALGHIGQGEIDRGWEFLAQGVSFWPPLVDRLDLFYELAYAGVPRGYGGQADLLDVEQVGTGLLKRLNRLFVEADDSLREPKAIAYGNAFLVLGQLSAQAGDWSLGRYYTLRALKANPRHSLSCSVMRGLLRLCAGSRLMDRIRRIREAIRRPTSRLQLGSED